VIAAGINVDAVSSPAATFEDQITTRLMTAATQNRCIAVLLSISPADRAEGSQLRTCCSTAA
jgi:hypothetical protein